MDSFESHLISRGFNVIAGVDEAGRGPLAGPVVAAAVVFDPPFPLDAGITDSKRLGPAKRLRLCGFITERARAVGIGVVGHREIDRINILNAALRAMALAVDDLSASPDHLLIDGNRPIDSSIPQTTVVRGDSRSVLVAAASIVAKVTRDRIMGVLHGLYPAYNFLENKGYPTREHLDALKKFGPSPVHRRTFRGVLRVR